MLSTAPTLFVYFFPTENVIKDTVIARVMILKTKIVKRANQEIMKNYKALHCFIFYTNSPFQNAACGWESALVARMGLEWGGGGAQGGEEVEGERRPPQLQAAFMAGDLRNKILQIQCVSQTISTIINRACTNLRYAAQRLEALNLFLNCNKTASGSHPLRNKTNVKQRRRLAETDKNLRDRTVLLPFLTLNVISTQSDPK